MKFGFEYSNQLHGLEFSIHVMIKPSIYLFDITPGGFQHMFGVIEEYPSIEYVDKINEDDEDDHQDGRLRIIGIDII
jgi:hypothetical protein